MEEALKSSEEEDEEVEEDGVEPSLSSRRHESPPLPPQRPDRVFLMEAELLLTAESERRRWAESRVLNAASIFLSNTLLVSWHLAQAKPHCRRPRSPLSSPAATFISWKRESAMGGCSRLYASRRPIAAWHFSGLVHSSIVMAARWRIPSKAQP